MIVRDVYRCEVTGNPYGHDTVSDGYECQCVVCDLCRKLESKNAEITRLKAELTSINDRWQCAVGTTLENAEELAAVEAEAFKAMQKKQERR